MYWSVVGCIGASVHDLSPKRADDRRSSVQLALSTSRNGSYLVRTRLTLLQPPSEMTDFRDPVLLDIQDPLPPLPRPPTNAGLLLPIRLPSPTLLPRTRGRN